MDSVRFGRALGVGARAAAKTLVTAVDAATSPNPSPSAASRPKPSQPPQSSPRVEPPRPAAARATRQVTQTVEQARQTTQGVVRGGKRFGEAVWRPFVRLSGVLWLEFTGVFFGIFALYAVSGAWKLRADLRENGTNHDSHMHFLMAAIMAAVFTYFCVSSFLRASRRGRAR